MSAAAPLRDDTPDPAVAIVVSHEARPLAWTERLGPEAVPVVSADARDRALAEALEPAEVALVDGSLQAPLSVLRRVHRLAPAVQGVVVADGPRLAALRRSARFTPGLGEPWLVEPSELGPDLLARGAAVARQRRAHARRMRQVVAQVERLAPPSPLAPVLSDAYLATLLELLPGPVLALDEDDRVLFANPSALEALEVEEIGREGGPPLDALLRTPDPELLRGVLRRSRREVVRRQIVLERGGGGRSAWEIVAAPVPGERPVRVLLLHDVTERVRAHARLEQVTEELEVQAEAMEAQAEERQRLLDERDRALDDLQAAMRHRSRFYASMSHELRTPINAIIGYSDLLLGGIFGELPPEHRDPLVRVGRAAAHLLDLVNDILDLSKLEAGKLTIEPEPVSVPDLVDDLTATIEPLARSNDVELRFDVHRSCDASVRTDPRRLRQVLMNLLSNAIRYGRGRPVEVSCRVVGDALETEVKDRGPGIPEDQTERIFEEFVQLEGAEAGGTGLGLSIARTLARSLGGDLRVAPRDGGGSTFTLTVPSLEG